MKDILKIFGIGFIEIFIVGAISLLFPSWFLTQGIALIAWAMLWMVSVYYFAL